MGRQVDERDALTDLLGPPDALLAKASEIYAQTLSGTAADCRPAPSSSPLYVKKSIPIGVDSQPKKTG